MGLPERFKDKSALEMNLGNEVVISCVHGDFLGVLCDINHLIGEVYLFPYVDWAADRKHAELREETPLAIGIGNFSKDRTYSVVPKPKGYMQSVIESSHKNYSIGFEPNLPGKK